MQQLYRDIFYSEKVDKLFTSEATIGYMLRFESALAMAQAKHGIIPAGAAVMISECCKVDNINKEQLINEAALGGNINIPLVKQLTAVVALEDKEAAKYVHLGATSQDVIDTAIMLQSRDAANVIADDLQQLIQQLATLVKEHKDTIMVGRSFMQHARPITFGYKAAGWLDAMLRSQGALTELLKEGFFLQFGGAVGTLAGMNDKGVQVSKAICEILNLQNPIKPWHTERDYFVSIATMLGMLNGNIGKIAKDISLMMQTEIAEVFEPSAKGKGGSSAMPHKRNPVGCIAILANNSRVPFLVATMLSGMAQDHERATGSWHSEWETIAAIIQLTAGSVRKAVELTNGLEIDKARMIYNLGLSNGLIYAENVSLALAHKIGKSAAHELVDELSKTALTRKTSLQEIVTNHPLIKEHLSPEEIENLFDPVSSLGQLSFFIEHVVGNVR